MTPSTSNAPTSPLFATNYRIYINHTDAGGIVYHANHLVFFENCRRDWFTQIGLNGYFLHDDDGQIQHFVVSQIDLKYRKAILLDEIIELQIDKVELKPASIIFYQSIHRGLAAQEETQNPNAKSLDTLLSSAKIVIACVQNQAKPESSPSTDAHSSSLATTTNNSPIRPIRVPKKLQEVIQQAVSTHNKTQ